MKTLLISVLLAVALTSTQVNTKEEVRERRQTADQCAKMINQNQQSLASSVSQISTACTTSSSCCSDCRDTVLPLRMLLDAVLKRLVLELRWILSQSCDISPPSSQCSSASGIFISLSAITLICVVPYFMN